MFRLVSLGQLLPGVDEADAIVKLQKITKLPAQGVRTKLLSGKKVSLMTSADTKKVAAMKTALTQAGLAVKIVPVKPEAEAESSAPATETAKPKKAKGKSSQAPSARISGNAAHAKPAGVKAKLILAGVAAVLVVGAAATFLGWQWLLAAPDDRNLQLEAALVNEQTVAVAYLNHQQMQRLSSLAGVDMGQLMSASEPNLLTEVWKAGQDPQAVLSGIYAAVQANPDGVTPMLLVLGSGIPWQANLAKFYQVDSQANGLLRLQPKAVISEFSCPGVDESAKPSFAAVGNDWFAWSDDEQTLLAYQQRQTPPGQSAQLQRWQQHRERNLASAMVFTPQLSAQALPGMMQMIAGQMAQTMPNVSGLAMSVRADLFNRSALINGRLLSNDLPWNQTNAQLAQQWLDAARSNPNVTSDVFASILATLQFSAASDAVDLDWSIGASQIADTRHALENAIASVFAGGFAMAADEELQLNDRPTNWQLPIDINNLPAYTGNQFGAEPLFVQGPFAVDFNGIRLNDNDNLTMTVKATAVLPKLDNESSLGDFLRYRLTVQDVTNQQGESILLDERCVTGASRFSSKNHEAETYGTAFFGEASASKEVRLKQGSNIADIAEVNGQYQISIPVQVQRFTPELRAGASVSYGDVTLEIVRVSEQSVRYKVSGAEDKLLEVRALTSDGRVIRQSWRSRFGKLTEQAYNGNISAIEIYMAGAFASTSTQFALSDMFAPNPDDESRMLPFTLSYKPVQRIRWNQYQLMDMRRLRGNSADWNLRNAELRAKGEKSWPGVKLYVTHDPEGWDANPMAHLYLPLMPELMASMSSLSYEMYSNEGNQETFMPVNFAYRTETYELVETTRVGDNQFGLLNFPLNAGYESGEKYRGVSGVLRMRLPQVLQEQDYAFNDLWRGQSMNGVTLSLENVSRGVLAGYSLKVEGELGNLISVHGMTEYGKKIAPIAVNYQRSGYWTIIIPFYDRLSAVRLVTATEQDEFEMAFRL